MKTRIISSAAALAVLAALMYLGREALGLAVFLAALIGIYEFYSAVYKAGYHPVKTAGYLACLPLLYPAVAGGGKKADAFLNSGAALQAIVLFIFILFLFLFCLMVFSNGRYNLADISITLFGILYVVFLFSFVTLTRNLENGGMYIWMVFIGAWATDTFAYFTGVSVGRTKIMPVISPKKSLEGSIGGILGCVAVMTVFGLLLGRDFPDAALYNFAVLGVLCGIVSQLGDWTASAVKRFAGIKDYGRIMPGHGGVLDRLDSILFTAPVVYFYIILFVR